jgi:biotin synthase
MLTQQAVDCESLAERVLAGGATSQEEALALLRSPDAEILDVLAAAYRIRRRYFGNRVRLHLLINAKSGLCPEDCHYCSQSIVSTADIAHYPLQSREVILAGADRAVELQAATYCIVTSGRGPTAKEVDEIAGIVREIKARYELKVCCCLGILDRTKADTLKAAGVDRYNHNLNTSAGYTREVVTTHTYEDRVQTVEYVKAAGISPCSGAILGMGETDEDVVSVAFALRAVDADSIPINFLHPIPGTPFAQNQELDPRRCLKILALMRFVNPSKEIRIAGGRELNLRSLQPLGLYAANSIFIGDYLTTQGQAPEKDFQMITDLGFEVEVHPPRGG